MGWFSDLLSSLGPDKFIGDDEEVAGDKSKLNVNVGEGARIGALIIGDLPGEKRVERRENDEVVIDPEKISDEEWQELKPALKRGWRTEEEVSLEPAYPFVSTVRQNIDDDYINETLDYFEGKMSFRFYMMLKNALYLNLAIRGEDHILRRDIENRKRQIATEYGTEAYSLANLCSAGYFEENRFFRELYHETVDSGDWDSDKYEDEIVKIIGQKPFVVFVSTDQSALEIHDLVRAKLQRLYDYDAEIEFIDVRGIGPVNHRTIEEAVYELKDGLDSLSYEKHAQNKEMIVRIEVGKTEV